MRDIAFMPQRDVFQSDDAVGAHYARHATDALGKNWIALMRHRARSLLPTFEFLLSFANFCALPVTNLQSELIERRGDDRQRAKKFGVVVTLNDLRRDGRGS